MSEIILTPKEQPLVPLEANNVTPDMFAGKSLDEIKNLGIWNGNRQERLYNSLMLKESPQITHQKSR